jgi:hypothetical protein
MSSSAYRNITVMRGPSMTLRGRGYFAMFCLASSVSAVMYLSIPYGERKRGRSERKREVREGREGERRKREREGEGGGGRNTDCSTKSIGTGRGYINKLRTCSLFGEKFSHTLTSECFIRSSTFLILHSSSLTTFLAPFPRDCRKTDRKVGGGKVGLAMACSILGLPCLSLTPPCNISSDDTPPSFSPIAPQNIFQMKQWVKLVIL